MSNNPNNKQVSIMAIACVTVIAVTMMVLTAMMNVASAQVGQPYDGPYRTTTLAEDLNIDFGKWRQYSEQELNLRQDTRNLFYMAGLVACGAIMNNNGNDDFAVGLAGGIVLTAGVDNVLSIIRRNKKAYPTRFINP